MAVLSDTDRAAVHAGLMRDLSDGREATSLTKPDLRAAVDATDAWIDANAAAFNAALPQPARSALTTNQKLRLFMLVARKRFGGG